MRRRLAVALTVLVAGFVIPAAPPAQAATIPSGFTDVLVGSVSSPTALAFTPDGRMLVGTKGGKLFVARNGTIAAAAALDISARVCTESERGLLGVAVDPAFAANGFVYLYYTAPNGVGACPLKQAAWPVNRVTRAVLGANDVIDPASEVVLFDGIPSVAGNHNAGDLGFGPDGMLYVSVGDSGCDYAAMANCGGSNDASRDTNVALGKILRISPVDGSAPSDNPFFGAQAPCRDDGFTTVGSHCPETWAWGFRNPFRFAFGTGHLYVNDVGQSSSEEVDDVVAGHDYGWNLREGKCVAGSTTNCPAPPANLTDPILAYGRADGCNSITGGAFAPASWPEAYRGDYLFADYICGKIFRIEGSTRVDFATALGANSAVHLEIGPDAALYYTTFAGGGQIRKIAPTAVPTGDGFLSDWAWVSAANGYGPVERDRSNGGLAAGDGGSIRLNGVVAAKGLGVHATSTVVYGLGGGVASFLADVGVDDECESDGSVVFQVFVDGVKRFDSGTMTGAGATKPVAVNVAGAKQLVLKVTDGGNGNACDHADWANARLA